MFKININKKNQKHRLSFVFLNKSRKKTYSFLQTFLKIFQYLIKINRSTLTYFSKFITILENIYIKLFVNFNLFFKVL